MQQSGSLGNRENGSGSENEGRKITKNYETLRKTTKDPEKNASRAGTLRRHGEKN